MPGAAAAMRDGFLSGAATGFYEVKCAQGFTCVSKVSVFGEDHSGAYEERPGIEVDERVKNAYEWGCPARGVVASSGECRDNGSSGSNRCFSTGRFEAGPNSPCDEDDKCYCIRTQAPDGTGFKREQSDVSSDVQNGSEVVAGKFNVQPPVQCDECSKHRCHPTECELCENCDYTTKIIDGRKTLGCFDADAGTQKSRKDKVHGRPYMEGQEAVPTDLHVVPHYTFWDPSIGEDGAAGAGLMMPYQNRQEPLSRKEWLKLYPEAALRMQRLVDYVVDKIKGDWAPNNEMSKDCIGEQNLNGQNKPDLSGRYEKVTQVLAACRHMQGVAQTLHAEPFPAGDGTQKVRCIRDSSGERCNALNCYFGSSQGPLHEQDSTTAQVQKALKGLRKRGKKCGKDWAAAKQAKQAEGLRDVHHKEQPHTGPEVHNSQGNPARMAAMPLILSTGDILLGGNSFSSPGNSHRAWYAARATSTNAEQRRA
eukprot:CAMPEP_0172864470 /NCGR_PEP_ID=MMETSP1075-20121228/80356_1 /TAXON_ID=2916 /ORGANISM="Ceratium fusus, Strain PA161109" /LENGTH=478 /DNA_ID=CAMNT_0013713369 /DNA_START=31 /DNA_END=1463 /DNA_ORIENTATION=-